LKASERSRFDMESMLKEQNDGLKKIFSEKEIF